ncbi:SulP family inorganic anion transporter [Mesorhizobium marinum]|uniref:SulP family inorganic anion transporter n=1 Tax=Mesorhizobium marinum TaxID=3228790 RepID=UPI0034650B65
MALQNPPSGSGQTTSSAIGIRPDLVAGLTAAAVVLPKAMAYATVAGLPVSVGLYTAFVPLIIYAFLGTSRVLSVSSTTTLAILTGAQLGIAVPDGDPTRLIVATATLTGLTGAILLAASVLKLGFVANFISAPVLTGFKAGIGLVIVLDQIPKLLGIHVEKEGFFRDAFSLVQHLPDMSFPTLVFATATLLGLFFMERYREHVPAPLIAMGVAITFSWYFGVADLGVATVGHIPQALPSPTIPDLALVQTLLPGALGIALMSFTETIAAGKAFSVAADPPIRPDRELVATGAANLAGAFLGSMPAGGGTSQTAVVRAVGGQTQKASLVTAAASAATMLVLAPLLGLLPQGVLAAIVIIYSIGLIKPTEFASILAIRRMEFWWAVVAFLGVLFFGTLQGIVVAIILSLVGLAAQVANPVVHVIGRKRGTDVLRPLSPDHPEDESVEGILVLRPEGRLFFLNAQQVADQIQAAISTYSPRVVVLDLSSVVDIEYSALQMLAAGHQRLLDGGVKLWLAELNPAVLGYLRASRFLEQLGPSNLYHNVEAALHAFETASLEDPKI